MRMNFLRIRFLHWIMTVSLLALVVECSGSTFQVAPSDVPVLAGTASGRTITLTWVDPTGMEDFTHLIFNWEPAGPAGSTSQPLQVEKGTETANISGLASGTSYDFKVMSVASTGNQSAFSPAFSIRTEDVIAPAVVADLTATPSAQTTVKLSWTEPTDTDFSHLLISWDPAGPAGSPAQPLQINKGTSEATIPLLEQVTSYSFTAKSVDMVGNESVASTAGTTTTLLRQLALFSASAEDGDFGFARCQTGLNDTRFPIGVQLRSRGYTKAVLFGSTPNYDFKDLATDTDALGILGQTEAALEARGLSLFAGTTSVTETSRFTPIGGGTASTRTIGNVVNVNGNGVWQNGSADVISAVLVGGPASFWSFTQGTQYSASENCSGATATTGTGTVGTVTGS